MEEGIRLILLFNEPCNYAEVVSGAVSNALASTREFGKEELRQAITVESVKTLPDGKTLARLTLSTELFEDNMFLLEQVQAALQDKEGIRALFKFYDALLQASHAAMYNEIFSLEMQLREVLSYIFLCRYPDSPYALLGEVNLKPDYPDKNSVNKRQERHEMVAENEFFFLPFSHYVKLTEPRKITDPDVFGLLATAESFASFQEQIGQRGIVEEKHRAFLDSIKDIMQPIETIRNCIAHNRHATAEEQKDYDIARSELEQKIKVFWENDA